MQVFKQAKKFLPLVMSANCYSANLSKPTTFSLTAAPCPQWRHGQVGLTVG